CHSSKGSFQLDLLSVAPINEATSNQADSEFSSLVESLRRHGLGRNNRKAMFVWQLLITNARPYAITTYEFYASHNPAVGVDWQLNQGSIEVSDTIIHLSVRCKCEPQSEYEGQILRQLCI